MSLNRSRKPLPSFDRMTPVMKQTVNEYERVKGWPVTNPTAVEKPPVDCIGSRRGKGFYDIFHAISDATQKRLGHVFFFCAPRTIRLRSTGLAIPNEARNRNINRDTLRVTSKRYNR